MPTLSEILRTKLIPWSLQDSGERFIIARRKMRQADMPYGVQLVPYKIQSERVIVKDRRCFGNLRNVIARWPDAGVYELGKYVLICVLEGHVDYTLSNYKVRCGPGHFIFIPPGIPHCSGGRSYVDLEKSTSCEIVTFLLHPSALECWMSHNDGQKRGQSDNGLILQENVVFLLQALMKAVTGEGYENVRINEKLLNLFFEILLCEVEAGRFQPTPSTVQTEQRIDNASAMDFSTHLEQYVQRNLHQRLTVSMVAAEMFFSPAQFTRVMRRETGKTFVEFLNEKHITEAKKILCSTDRTITTIASMVGCKSHRYFRTLFKHHTGLTATEFRQKASKNKS